jgi:hypothetical protein
MKESEIIEIVRKEFEETRGPYGGRAYRCAAVLNDGLYLPCMLLTNAESIVELALRRFEETRFDAALPEPERRFGKGGRYADIVQSFVANGNRLASYDIQRIEKSKFSIHAARMAEVHGETSMGWTQFTAVMRDGREFAFGTTYLMEFFSMPDGYTGDDVTAIISHKGGKPTYRERPYFTCFVHGL